MISLETFSFYIMICVLAPLIGAFTILFLFIFEKRFEALETQANKLALEKELQESKYEILSQKIQPHFFFNTLNMILSLARLDRKKDLIHSIETLAIFMKRKYTVDEMLNTVQEEITYTKQYLNIQKLRLGRRLVINIDIDDEANKVLIPSYVIQTLTENCFKHSFEKNEGMARLSILIRIVDQNVRLEIWNNKKQESKVRNDRKNVEESNGIGLENIRERLNLLYPLQGAELSLHEFESNTLVCMVWPIQYKSNEEEN
ncbi:sensor histidine kinase [Corticicoccus populi]|uniref:histidine kinase n=1 Tax=Corticicoccus populi TaxID=1812821 RepID=A0ABW5X041_9STAP